MLTMQNAWGALDAIAGAQECIEAASKLQALFWQNCRKSRKPAVCIRPTSGSTTACPNISRTSRKRSSRRGRCRNASVCCCSNRMRCPGNGSRPRTVGADKRRHASRPAFYGASAQRHDRGISKNIALLFKRMLCLRKYGASNGARFVLKRSILQY